MFTVYKIKDTKTKQHINIKLNTTKKSNIFTNINSSPMKSEEKPTSSSNSFSINTNNSSDSGKGITNFLQNEKTFANTSQKNEFLSKKTKFHIDFVDKPKQIIKNLNENNTTTNKKKKKNKIITTNSEEDINEGRWEPDEHIRFIEAINKFGNEWKEVQKYVGTRSSNQVRSHAQKFFLKLKNFKDPTLGIDFTVNNIKNLSEIIYAIKEFEKENKCVNMLSVLSKKLSERNLKSNNNSFLNKNYDDDVFIKNNKIIIKNEYVNENINNNIHTEFIIKNEDIIKSDSNNTPKKIKKIVKFYKRKINKNIKLKENEIENKNENIINDEKNENKDKENIYNKIKYDEHYFDYDNNKNYCLGDYTYDNLNQLECETNNQLLLPFPNCIKESNTISIMNRNYYC